MTKSLSTQEIRNLMMISKIIIITQLRNKSSTKMILKMNMIMIRTLTPNQIINYSDRKLNSIAQMHKIINLWRRKNLMEIRIPIFSEKQLMRDLITKDTIIKTIEYTKIK